MAIEMRKRPIIRGKDAMKFLSKAEKNSKLLASRKEQALKKWNEKLRDHRD
ncbi:hypothetical protein [Lysinibacillus sp. 54212]|uniref:hypothetical protein n=1 Tax=Lysinibacillus sp. 54212 TaxID=3119829 RepID=UPI002FCA06DE